MTDKILFKELSVGRKLCKGKYIIERVLGVGGFGITYYAKHTTLNIYCAIKEFFISGYCLRHTQTNKVHLQGISDTEYGNYKQKFLEEAQTLAKLDHPNIVRVIDMFEENDTSYIVMPFIEGTTLQQLVEKEGTLAYEVAVNYIAQLSNAIAYIHERNILHRDIKPDNIILTPDYQVILVDFGSAREFVHDKTQSHTAILTKGYAPLEQYSNIGKKGSYSDIYSLGAVFYFALTGQKPIDAAARTMEPMSEPKDLNPSIPDEANHTIMKAMQLKPEDRYQVVSEFMDDLLETKKETSRSKNRWIFIAAGIGLLLGIGVGVYYLIAYTPDKKEAIELSYDKNINPANNDTLQVMQPNQDESTTPQTPETTQTSAPQTPTVSETTPTTKVETDPSWITEFNKIIAQADKYSDANNRDYNLDAALKEYKKALTKIPSTDKSNKKEEVLSKIALCENKIAWNSAINAARSSFVSEDYLTAKTEYEKAAQIAQSMDIAFIEESQQGVRDCETKIQEVYTSIIQQANDSFNKGGDSGYSGAFTLYQKAKNLNPSDMTGYNRFLNKVKELIAISGKFDDNIKKLLLYAQELNDTSEVRTLLLNCE